MRVPNLIFFSFDMYIVAVVGFITQGGVVGGRGVGRDEMECVRPISRFRSDRSLSEEMEAIHINEFIT